MDRFLSNAVNNVDAKGRVSVPAFFRQALAARGSGELYALQSIAHPAIDVGGLDLLKRYEERMEAEDPFGETYADMSLFTYGDGAFLKFDAEGRIAVNDFIRSHTGITGPRRLRRAQPLLSALGALAVRGAPVGRAGPAGGCARRFFEGIFAGRTGMTADLGGTEDPADGGPVRHRPVLLGEVLDALRPAPGERMLDGTFGAGGYTRAILDRGADVIAIDRDPGAVETAMQLAADVGGRLAVAHGRFGELDRIAATLGAETLDGVVLDIGVSSMQIDEAERGFSFQKDGPLDMRMSRSGPTAADVVNTLKTGDLARIFNFLGEERQAGRIARAIEARRATRPFETTLDLAGLVLKTIGRAPKDKIDPATRTFQALRIFVNDELGELARALSAAERALKPGGRLVVVTFHSLEDRIVKRFLRDRSEQETGSRHLPGIAEKPLTFTARNKAVAGGEAEIAANPRARSAKLRLGLRTESPPRDDMTFFDLPTLADLPGA